jgi:integrase
MALSENRIKALKPRPVRYLVTDGSGLAIEVLPSGKLSWIYRFRTEGKPGKVAIGRYPIMSLKQARQKRDELAQVVAQGRSPAREKQLARTALAEDTTVYDFGERYFKEIVQRDCKDARPNRRYLDREIYPTMGQKVIRDVTVADVERLVFRKRDGGQPASAGQIRNLLKRMFDYALARGVVTVNPATSIPMRYITQARPRTRALSQQEIRIYLHTLYGSNIRRQFKLALHIILLTLVRKGEMGFAKWEHVDFDAREWHIPSENSKTGKPHIVYMSLQAIELFLGLKELASGSPWVLPGRSSIHKPFAANALNKALENIHFEIPPFTIHDMRRTSSTLLHEKGFPSDVVEKALNHTIGGVRGVYNRAEYAEQRKKMLQFWGDYIEGIATESKVIVGNFHREVS